MLIAWTRVSAKTEYRLKFSIKKHRGPLCLSSAVFCSVRHLPVLVPLLVAVVRVVLASTRLYCRWPAAAANQSTTRVLVPVHYSTSTMY
jgi:hypothetical protein